MPEGQLRYDVADAIVRPEVDQLAGACKNFFSVQSWVDISNSNYCVTWATMNAPLIEIGGIRAEQPWMKSIGDLILDLLVCREQLLAYELQGGSRGAGDVQLFHSAPC